MQVTINTNKILLDREMTDYFKKHCEEQLRIMGANSLPNRFDISHDKININNVNKIKKAYQDNNEHTLPLVNVERFKNTSFYKIKDGRHRVVVAFCNNVPQLNVHLEAPHKQSRTSQMRKHKNTNTKRSSRKRSTKKRSTKKRSSTKQSTKKRSTKKHKKKHYKKYKRQ